MERLTVGALLLLSSASLCSGQSLTATRISNDSVKYVARDLKEYPAPPVVFLRSGLASEADRNEILEKIIYAAVKKSDRPVAALIVELFSDKSSIAVTLVWHERVGEGNFASALIERNVAGHFDQDAWKTLFPDKN